jgi:hypothetical protein
MNDKTKEEVKIEARNSGRCNACQWDGPAGGCILTGECRHAPTLRAGDFEVLHAGRQPAPTPCDLSTTLIERGGRYGKFTGHAVVTQELKTVIICALVDRDKSLDADQQEALDMICHKIGRIVNGDPNYADSWIDIAGYAKLVADRLEGVER